MALETINLEEFLSNGMLLEDEFFKKANDFNFGRFSGKSVLIRGCESTIIPPWAYMFITGKLVGLAKAIRFGNEHDNVTIYRK